MLPTKYVTAHDTWRIMVIFPGIRKSCATWALQCAQLRLDHEQLGSFSFGSIAWPKVSSCIINSLTDRADVFFFFCGGGGKREASELHNWQLAGNSFFANLSFLRWHVFPGHWPQRSALDGGQRQQSYFHAATHQQHQNRALVRPKADRMLLLRKDVEWPKGTLLRALRWRSRFAKYEGWPWTLHLRNCMGILVTFWLVLMPLSLLRVQRPIRSGKHCAEHRLRHDSDRALMSRV